MKVGVKINVFNFAMRNRRAELKMSQKLLSQIAGVTLENIGRIETLKMPRSRDAPGMAAVLTRVANALCVEFDALFPPDYLAMIEAKKLPRTSSFSFIKEISMDAISSGHVPRQLIAPSAEEMIETLYLEDAIKKAFKCLTDREQWVITHRFGLFGNDNLKLEEAARLAGKELGYSVTRERIRQIEAKALRKLRYPTISRFLRQWISE